MNKIAPSVFAADWSNISDALKLFEKVHVDMIHYDVMDNHFVPNVSFGAKVIGDISRKTKIPADVHLMIDLDKPERIQPFLDLDIPHITFHMEAMQGNIMETIELIRKYKKTVGISIKPGTPVVDIQPYLDRIDLVLLMSVEPGFSGQKFMADAFNRLRELRNQVGNRRIDIQIDGGIGRNNYRQVLDCGANFLVMGSAFFSDQNIEELVSRVRGN